MAHHQPNDPQARTDAHLQDHGSDQARNDQADSDQALKQSGAQVSQQAPVSWTALLAATTELAQRSLTLPDTAEGDRWKRAVPHALALHGIAMALEELERLEHDDRPVAMDTSELQIREHAGAIIELWRAEPMPDGLDMLIQDARRSWELALYEGLVWVAAPTADQDAVEVPHPADLGPELIDRGFYGELLLPTPGTRMFRGAPVATVRDRDGGPPETWVSDRIEAFLKRAEGGIQGPALMRPIVQVYRTIDFLAGGPVSDNVAPALDDPEPGQPLLIPIVSGGAVCPVPPPRKAAPLGPLPVRWPEPDTDEPAGG